MPDSTSSPALNERKFYREWWLTSLLALSLLALATFMQWGQSAGQLIYDQFHRWQSPQADPRVVVVAIDDASLDALGGWPLDRQHYARLLTQLARPENKPLAIGFDLLFLDPSPSDAMLAESMRQHRVLLPSAETRQPGETRQRQPVPVLRQAASGLAHIHVSFESDGTLRGAHLRHGDMDHLALALMGQRSDPFSSHDSYRRFAQVNPRTGMPTVSLADALSGQFPLSLFKDKYVLMGATSPSLGDQFPGIHAGQHNAGTPGVIFHASLLSALLQDKLIAPIPAWLQQTIGGLALVCVLLGLLLLSPVAELLVSLSMAAGLLVLSLLLLVQGQLWFDPGLALMGIVLVKPIWAWRRSEMVLHFLRQGVNSLGQDVPPPPSHTMSRRPFWRLRSDTMRKHARLLNRAIGRTRSQLYFLNRLVSEIPNALLVADIQGCISLVNPRMHDSLPSGLLKLGEPLLPLLFYLGLNKELQLQQLTGKDQYVSAIDSLGGLRHYVFHLAQVKGEHEDDEPWWILVLTDITDMRQLQLGREKTLQLLSHDMRTPLASIMALTRQAQAGQEASTFASAALKIGQHANTLLQMMDDFIFSIKAQAPEYTLVEVLLDSLVDEAVFQVKDLAQGRNMRVVVQFDDNPPFIRADQRLLVRMLVNLLVNAVRYGQAHTDIVLSLSHIPHGQPGEDGWLHLSIRNTVGLPDSAGQTPEVAMGGFGLGLEFVKTVVRKHAGRIQFDLPAEPGALAQVHLQLPLVDLR